MNAYTVVGPTNRQPRRFRSFAIATDSAVCAGISPRMHGPRRARRAGSNRHTYAASEPSDSTNSTARPALLITASILPRWRMIDASFNNRATSLSSNRATAL